MPEGRFLDVRDYAKLDPLRHERTGVPEVILAEGKLDDHLVGAARDMLAKSGRGLVSRLDPARAPPLLALHAHARWSSEARFLALGPEAPRTGGRVLVLAAGTADVPVAEEARLVAQELGCETRRHYDVGVAGLHRLLARHAEIREARVLVVVAGMEGALASVVGGLVDRPVIAVPTSAGYGMNLAGVTTLLAMMNACAPNVSVVNVDNGFGAAYVASLINRTGESA